MSLETKQTSWDPSSEYNTQKLSEERAESLAPTGNTQLNKMGLSDTLDVICNTVRANYMCKGGQCTPTGYR